MKTTHKLKSMRIGKIIDGAEFRRQFLPDYSQDRLEELTLAVLNEEIRLGEIALKGTTSPANPTSPFFEEPYKD